jgi:hypothetical protein
MMDDKPTSVSWVGHLGQQKAVQAGKCKNFWCWEAVGGKSI